MSTTQIIVSLNHFVSYIFIFNRVYLEEKTLWQRSLISFLKNRTLIYHVFCNDESLLIWSRDALFYGDQLIGNVRWTGGLSEWWTHIAATELWLIPVSCAEVCIVGDWWCGQARIRWSNLLVVLVVAGRTIHQLLNEESCWFFMLDGSIDKETGNLKPLYHEPFATSCPRTCLLWLVVHLYGSYYLLLLLYCDKLSFQQKAYSICNLDITQCERQVSTVD